MEEEQNSTAYDTWFEGRLCIAVWVGFLFVTHGPSDDFRIETSIHFWTSNRVSCVFRHRIATTVPWMGMIRHYLEFGPVRRNYKSEAAEQRAFGGLGRQMSCVSQWRHLGP